MVAKRAWKWTGALALLHPALLGCGSEPLESEDGFDLDTMDTAEGAALPTRAELLDAVVGYCSRLSTYCPDFSAGLCTDVQVSLLPEEGHRCHASVVRRTMCLTSLEREQLECASRLSAAPKPGYCEQERASATACYEHP
jgi:hypothetical protein